MGAELNPVACRHKPSKYHTYFPSESRRPPGGIPGHIFFFFYCSLPFPLVVFSVIQSNKKNVANKAPKRQTPAINAYIFL